MVRLLIGIGAVFAVLTYGGPEVTEVHAADGVLVGAGDIARCGNNGDEVTAAILSDQSKVPTTATIATFGDNAYEDGRPSEFDCFNEPLSWGPYKSRMAASIGNHDARDTTTNCPDCSTDADAYFNYFIDQAPAPAFGPGNRGQGWYAYNLETWKVVVLNSTCNGTAEDFCDHNAQLTFLQTELQNAPQCTLIYMHHTVISSKAPIIDHGGADLVGDPPGPTHNKNVWEMAYDYGVDLVVTGHAHNYQRYARLSRDLTQVDLNGVSVLVVGTGGAQNGVESYEDAAQNALTGNGRLEGFMYNIKNSQDPNADTSGHPTNNAMGVIKLTLGAGAWDWIFLPQSGKTFSDSGHRTCRGSASDWDGDGVADTAEDNCGGASHDASRRPERVDVQFDNIDDDGDAQVDEALPAGSEAYDCDGDGYVGATEAHVFQASGSSQHDQDPCGTSGWPSDLFAGTFQPNTLNIQDLGTFVTSPRRMDTSPGDTGFDVRWDLVPGSTFGKHINVQDIGATVAGTTSSPPMFNGGRAFGQMCPWGPGSSGPEPGAPSSGGSSNPVPINLVAIDLNADGVPANTATSIGTIESCRYLGSSETFDIDVVVVSVPDAAQQAGGIIGFQFKLTLGFPAATWVMASNPSMILAANAGSSLLDAGDAVQPPDKDGLLQVAALDTSESSPESGAGALARITLYGIGGDSGLFGSAPWERTVSLSDVALIDAAGNTYVIENIKPAKLKGGFANPCLPGE